MEQKLVNVKKKKGKGTYDIGREYVPESRFKNFEANERVQV